MIEVKEEIALSVEKIKKNYSGLAIIYIKLQSLVGVNTRLSSGRRRFWRNMDLHFKFPSVAWRPLLRPYFPRRSQMV